MMQRPYPVHYDVKHDAWVYRAPGLDVDEAVMPNTDDAGFSIYIKEDLGNEAALKSYYHALEHIEESDHQKNDVQQIEAERHHLPRKAEAPQKKKITWMFTYFDLFMLRTYPTIREFFGLDPEDLPEEPLWPPKDGKESMQYYEQMEALMDYKMAEIYAEIHFRASGGRFPI